ncbi:hypothetical protein SPOG_03706 [Schizosaccharomyces cryophilus OY26]|uniref:SUN domain-containing protein n=1 Tax=Schizosaccharomyces cryophilus (strain OY26 / ATCC MYA-4695 / CBS 11777 / NBRC 106824 / NRRL Y48691) TaxID=653667 RepID=S9VZR0_SCHCR|nr:uncharacterized protein SPOG_03706 [Schizosaccharomyces cryophilus OY26]EPY53168.1 hypothetical protein SPOG_03706 [Schizosaccharomyces cryophilus OY26]
MSESRIPVSETSKPALNEGYERGLNNLQDDASIYSNGRSRKAFVGSRKQKGRTAKRKKSQKEDEYAINKNFLRNAFFYCIFYVRFLGWTLWRSYSILKFLVYYRKRIILITFLLLMSPIFLLTQDYETARLRTINWIVDYIRRFTAIWKPNFEATSPPSSNENINVSYELFTDYPEQRSLVCTAISFPFLQSVDALFTSFDRVDSGSFGRPSEELSKLYKSAIENTKDLENNWNLLCTDDALNPKNSKWNLLEKDAQEYDQALDSLQKCLKLLNHMARSVYDFKRYNDPFNVLILKDIEQDFFALILNYAHSLPEIIKKQNVLISLVYPNRTAMTTEIGHLSAKSEKSNNVHHLENCPSTVTKVASHETLTNLTKSLDDARKDVLKAFESLSVNSSLNRLKDISRSYVEQTVSRLKNPIVSQPNFALKAIGASIDYAWTFPKPTVSEIFKEYWSKKTNIPAVLLSDNINSCWCSTQSLAQVAIEVPKPIYISHISLLQPVHGDESSFPQKLRVFGLLDKHTNANEALKNQESLLLLGEIPVPPMLSTVATVFHLPKYSENPEQLSQFFYKRFVIQASSSREHSNSLCLYHIGIHGKEINLQ